MLKTGLLVLCYVLCFIPGLLLAGCSLDALRQTQTADAALAAQQLTSMASRIMQTQNAAFFNPSGVEGGSSVTPPPPGGSQSVQKYHVVLPANQKWMGTGVRLVSGQVVTMDASGVISLSQTTDAKCDPDGMNPAYICNAVDCTVEGLNTGLLIARIGQGKPFKAGKHSQFTASSGGELELTINDDAYTNNSGSFDVNFTVGSP